MLRTGIGVQRQYSQSEVAEALGTSVSKERQLERDAAAALRRVAFDRRCGRGASFPAVLLIPASVLEGLQKALGPIGVAQVSVGVAEPRMTRQVGVTYTASGSSHRTPSVRASISGGSALKPVGIPPPPRSGVSFPSWIFILLGLAGSILLLTPLGRSLLPFRLPASSTAGIPARGGNPAVSAEDGNERADFVGEPDLATLLYAWYTVGPHARDTIRHYAPTKKPLRRRRGARR
jgi:hypothetical protein